MEYTTLDKICENLDFQRKPITSSDRVAGNIPYYGASGIVDYVQDYIFDEKLLLVSEDGANLLARSTPIAFSVEGKTWINNHAHVLRFADNTVQKYVELYLNSISLEPYISGSAQPKLNQKMLNKIPIPLVDKETMELAVSVVERVKQLINIRKKELEELDNLIKSRFVEMFDDGEKYDKEALKGNVQEMFIGPFGSTLKNEYFVDEEDSYCMVYEQKHAIQKKMNLPTRYVDEKKYNELKRFTVRGGDIIVSCRGTIGEIYSVPDDAPMGIMHPSIMKIRLKNEKYCNLFFVMMLNQYMQENIAMANGSGIKMAVTATDLGNELFVVPSIDEQKEFERFVHQVDKFKFKVEKSLNETQQLFDSLMQKYFG